MFIRSNMETSVFYNKGEHSIELKPQTITYVDDTIVSKKELVDCYGDRITLIAEEIAKEILEDGATPADEANTGDKGIDAFLNGETDKLPEDTIEITEEEAKKLEEEKAAAEATKKAEEEAKAKAEEEAKKLEEEKTAKAKAKTAKAPAKNTKTNKKGDK